MNVKGWDTETQRFGPQLLVPPLVCITTAQGESYGNLKVSLIGRADGMNFVAAQAAELVWDTTTVRVAHNAAFDLAILSGEFPDLIPYVFEALAQGQHHDTGIREKLLTLATTGDLDFLELPGGRMIQRKWNLDFLAQQILGVTREKTKIEMKDGKRQIVGDEDAWRLNYWAIAHIPTAQWPDAAKTYAIDDAADAVLIFHDQERRRQQMIRECGIDPFITERLHIATAFALYLVSAWGCAVDVDRKNALQEKMNQELSPERLNLLYASGILRPAVQPQPHKNGAKNHVEGCTNKKTCSCPPKMTEGKPPSINEAILHEYVKQFCQRTNSPLKMNPATDKNPEGTVSVTADWLEEHAHKDNLPDGTPGVLGQLKHRNSLQKIITNDLPKMDWELPDGTVVVAPVLHPNFDVLKSTGRTSSYASEAYPSFNCQQTHPEVCACIVPRPGNLLFSIDISLMELGTLAQKCLDLFGKSVMAEKINAGVDLHAYIGAQIATAVNPNFAQHCMASGCSNADDIFELFEMLYESQNPLDRDFYNHWRKLAKPTGLGYPGGLGPDTFVKFAKASYGVDIDLNTAETLRERWKETYPEVVYYFQWINQDCKDWRNGPKFYRDAETGEEKKRDRYCYQSPMGMWRFGADYCAAANGAGLQTPSAEGAKMGLFNVVRGCYDVRMGNDLLLGKVRPTMFIHDEIVGELPDDSLAHDRCREIQRIMEGSMSVITPKVKARTEAVLMRRWDKRAKPTFDPVTNRLIPWEPKAPAN